jgi:hypothetical protein
MLLAIGLGCQGTVAPERGGKATSEVAPPAFAGSGAGDECQVAGVKRCWGPPGEFTMGSPPGEPDRRPGEDQVEVTRVPPRHFLPTEALSLAPEGTVLSLLQLGTPLRDSVMLARLLATLRRGRRRGAGASPGSTALWGSWTGEPQSCTGPPAKTSSGVSARRALGSSACARVSRGPTRASLHLWQPPDYRACQQVRTTGRASRTEQMTVVLRVQVTSEQGTRFPPDALAIAHHGAGHKLLSCRKRNRKRPVWLICARLS